LPGSFNRQQFNPASQTFTPGQPPPPQAQFGHATAYGPSYTTPQGIQRQTPAQPQNSNFGSPYPGHYTSGLPSSQGLTHPLPQPVFSDSFPVLPRQSAPIQVSGHTGNFASPRNTPMASMNSISKYDGTSLPAKPPPPAEDHHSSLRGLGPISRSPAMTSPIYPLPSVANFAPGSASNGGTNGMQRGSMGAGRPPMQQ